MNRTGSEAPSVFRVAAVGLALALSLGCSKDEEGTSDSYQDVLSWNANAEADLAGYHVYRSSSAGGPYTLVSTVGKSTTALTVNVGASPPSYHCVVKAVDAAGNVRLPSLETSAP